MDIVYFVGLVGALVFVHELGHFACAKFFRVHVVRFSLGFGPRVFGFRVRGTEYVLSAMPLGGYVRMFGEDPSEPVRPKDLPRSFYGQPRWRRSLIVLAGPAMNLILPVLIFGVVHAAEGHGSPAVVGTVFPGRPAAGKLQPGDRVLAIDGESVTTFRDLSRIVEKNAGRTLAFTIDRGEGPTDVDVTAVETRVQR